MSKLLSCMTSYVFSVLSLGIIHHELCKRLQICLNPIRHRGELSMAQRFFIFSNYNEFWGSKRASQSSNFERYNVEIICLQIDIKYAEIMYLNYAEHT